VENAQVAVPEIGKALEAVGVTVRRIEKIVPSLEDVFVTLIETA
jgi:ABC-2 type transport system ATP-binding protein